MDVISTSRTQRSTVVEITKVAPSVYMAAYLVSDEATEAPTKDVTTMAAMVTTTTI